MPQRLSPGLKAGAGDPAHVAAAAPEISLIIRAFLLLALLFLPGILRAQGRATMQVAAQILPVEPSRTALGLAIESLDALRPAARQSRLARIRVESALPTRPTPSAGARMVRIDFLRN